MRVRDWFKSSAEREQDDARDKLKAVRKAMQAEIDALQNALTHATDKGRNDATN